jgi:Asp-tRNA(Asn)/Glu-tRNA(Gln) amidotransferase A subunit family amidase
MAAIHGDVPPPELLEAFGAYERALMCDDLSALDDAFVDDGRALRGDASGLLVGREQISAFRGARGGAPARTVRQIHVRRLDPDHVVLVSVNEPQQGGRGLVTQVWQRCADGHWRIAVAQVAGPQQAADPTIWRLLGFPLVAPTGSGDLDGECVAVKDLFAVAGLPVGAGNPAYLAEAGPERRHAAAVRALLDAGAEVRGIARTDEFAYSITGANAHYGTPPNPRAPGRLPGGSSSGPAAAVAAGQASIGLGTDTAGSIRVPASYQRLWGLRSTHGAVSAQGLLPLAPSFDAIGWLARSPEVLARAAKVSLASEPVAGGEYVLCRGLLETADPSVRRAFTETLDTIPKLREIQGPDPKEAFAAFRTVQAAEAWRTHATWLQDHPDVLGPDVAARFAWAATVTDDEEQSARGVLAEIRARLDSELQDGVLLLPATPTPAPPNRFDAASLDAIRTATISLTCLAAITGRPALSAPLLEAEGLPVGLSLIGPHGTDLDLIERAVALAPHGDRS